MASLGVPAEFSSDALDDSYEGAPGSSRRTSHTGRQGSLGYGIGVVWHHLRPFIPFFLISCLVVALVYLLQFIVYGGPFRDPLFFVKFNERWPKTDPNQQKLASPIKTFSPIAASLEEYPFNHHAVNGTDA